MPEPVEKPKVELFDAEELVVAPTPLAATPPTPPTPPASKYSARSLRLAEEFGMSKGEIESHTPEELDSAVYNQQLAVNRLAKQLWAADAHRQALERPAPPAPPPPPPANPEDEFLGQFDDKYNPEMVALAKFTAAQAKELRELKKQGEERTKREVEQGQQSRMEMIDTGFAALPARLQKLFGGDASAAEMDHSSRDWKRRLSALHATGININESFTQRQLNRALAAAAEAMFGDLVADAAPAAPANTAGPYGEAPVPPAAPVPPKNPLNGRFVSPAEYEAGALARPTDRKDRDEPNGEAKAKKNLAAKLRERGIAVDDGRPGDATLEDFPG